MGMMPADDEVTERTEGGGGIPEKKAERGAMPQEHDSGLLRGVVDEVPDFSAGGIVRDDTAILPLIEY